MLKWIKQLLDGWRRPNSTAEDVKWLLEEKKRREENKQRTHNAQKAKAEDAIDLSKLTDRDLETLKTWAPKFHKERIEPLERAKEEAAYDRALDRYGRD
jgi:hypothetical protein